jgi:CBS domain-containing protein
MRLSEVLREKPQGVVGLPPSATAAQASALMEAERVGAVVVRDYRGRLLGILSERDLAIGLAAHGADLFRIRVGALMAIDVPTASPGDAVRDLVRTITERRARHVPVLDGETVVGVVSVGDLLKARLAEKNQENAVLQDLARARLPA